MASFDADPVAVQRFIDRFFSALVQAGVEHAVISPGSRSTPLTLGADRARGLRTWVQLDERSAAFFALGLAKASGRPAALICTSGTAAANYLPAIIEAHYARVPMIVATADRPPELRDWGAGQTIEQLGLYGRYARWVVEVPVPTAGDEALRYAGQLAARACDEAVGTPAGAVHLNWPLREPLAPAAVETPVLDATPPGRALHFSRARSLADPEDVRELVSLVRARERGVIVCGPMDPGQERLGAIREFATIAGWPVFADPASQLRGGERSDGTPILDMGDALARSPGFASRMRPEVVIRIGDPSVSKAQRLWIESAEPEEIWWLDEGGSWGEPSHRATRVVRGGAASLLGLASAELGADSRREGAWCRELLGRNAIARKTMEDVALAERAWSGLAVAATLAKTLPAESVLFASNSMAIRLLDLAFARRPGAPRVLASRGASGIDGINSTALGVAAAAGSPSVLFTGDLAFLHDLGGLAIARRERIPLTIVVLDDNGGGIFSLLPLASQRTRFDFDRLFHTPHDLDLARAAALFELDHEHVDSIASLEDALRRALARPGVSVVHARVDARENEARFRDAVRRVCEAVDAGGGS